MLIVELLLCVILTELLTELAVKSEIFRPVRNMCAAANSWLGKLIKCGYCFSLWAAVGVVFLTQTQYPLTGNQVLDLGLMALVIHRLSNYLHNFNDKILDKYYSMSHLNSQK